MSLRDILYKTDLQLSEFYRVLQAGLCAFLINTFEKLPIINSNLRPSQHLKRSFLGHQLIPLRRYIIDVTEVPGTPLKLVTIKSLKKGGGGRDGPSIWRVIFRACGAVFPGGIFPEALKTYVHCLRHRFANQSLDPEAGVHIFTNTKNTGHWKYQKIQLIHFRKS